MVFQEGREEEEGKGKRKKGMEYMQCLGLGVCGYTSWGLCFVSFPF